MQLIMNIIIRLKVFKLKIKEVQVKERQFKSIYTMKTFL